MVENHMVNGCDRPRRVVGYCAACTDPIFAGDDILRDVNTDDMIHEDCKQEYLKGFMIEEIA